MNNTVIAGGAKLDLVYRHHEEVKMPPRKKFQSRSVALAEQDRIAVAQLANELGKTQGEIARDAIRWYVENYKTTSEIYRVGEQIVNVILRSTDKICKLLLRCTIDSNITMMLFYRMLPEAEADQIMLKMRRMAVSRIARKIAVDDAYCAELIQNEINDIAVIDQLPKAS